MINIKKDFKRNSLILIFRAGGEKTEAGLDNWGNPALSRAAAAVSHALCEARCGFIDQALLPQVHQLVHCRYIVQCCGFRKAGRF